MKTSLITENLQKKILFVSHAISTRNQLPILLNFLIEAGEGKITISATDLEIGITADIPAKTEKEGSITVPAKTFTEILGNTSSSKINMETTQEGLALTGEGEKTVFQTIPTDEFPKLYKDKGKQIMVLKDEAIKKDFSKVVFAASLDSERPALSGVMIKEEKDGFLLVATDGYRLSLKKQALQGSKKTKTEDIIIEIINEQSQVIGEDLAVAMAVNSGVLKFNSKGYRDITLMSADPTVVFTKLIGSYENLFGKASVEVCFNVLRRFQNGSPNLINEVTKNLRK